MRLAVLATMCLVAAPGPVVASDAASPLLLRIQMVTVGTDDIGQFTAAWERWLNYETFERGEVSAELAGSWGAPATAGRDYALMRGEGSPGVWIRVVDVDVPEPHEALTTFGWNAIELLVEDPDAAYERLLPSEFRHIGGPANLGGGTSSIRATQFVGPASVTVYLTADTAEPDAALLPRAKSFIDRPFIMVLATPDPDATFAFYQERFNMGGYPPRPIPVGILSTALGMPDDHLTPLGLARGAEPGNSIEIDGYPPQARTRPVAPGQLPPASAITSFAVESLDELDLPFIEPPARLYGERRAATFIGPAGELTELIEVGNGDGE